MGFVRKLCPPAWVSFGPGIHGSSAALTEAMRCGTASKSAWRTGMQDLLYIGLTIVVFGVLWLIVKGIETFER
jgi:hypothetical protein